MSSALRLRAFAVAIVLAIAATVVPSPVVPSPAGASAPPAPAYRPPVDTAVSDPFRAPTTPFGPGNRGLEYDTAPGTPVRAAAAGRITFAGAVAGARHVTVFHADGLRTTASYLDTIAVVIGQQVEQGEVLGTTAGRLHFSARNGDAYLDPAALFAPGPPEVWLVPFDVPPGLGLPGERSAIRQLLGVGGDLVHLAVGVGEEAWDRGSELFRLLREEAPLLIAPLRVADRVLTTIEVLRAAWEESQRPCTSSDVAVPPPSERRIAVLVAGLGSTSGHASVDDVDVAALGYEPSDVVRASYVGGRTPASTGHPAGVAVRSYDSADSRQDLHESGWHLADLVEQMAAGSPGVPIDLIAHSQGGLVARLAVIELQRRGSAGAVASLATIGTPHQGADLATAAHAIGMTPGGQAALRALGPIIEQDPDAPSTRQLSEASDLIAELTGTPLPPGMPAVSIGGRADLVVPVPRTHLDGARSVVIPTTSGHGDLPEDPITTRELLLALAGAPPGCRSIGDALLDQAAGQVISHVEDDAGSRIAGLMALGGAGLPR